MTTMNYDEILLKIGEFGWWQKKAILVLLMIPAFTGGMLVMTTAFTAKIPEQFNCNITSTVTNTLLTPAVQMQRKISQS